MLRFEKTRLFARFISPQGETVETPIEVRVNPITGRTCRITFSRIGEREAATDFLPEPPPFAGDTGSCPFCRPQVHSLTPQVLPAIAPSERMAKEESLLFPNLFPYGAYSAVSLIDNNHFVEIGRASRSSYANSFLNCADYLHAVLAHDPQAVWMAITQNHLPSAGGSLLHPHLQVQADRIASNHHRFLNERANQYFEETGSYLFSDYLEHERAGGSRFIGETGDWQWLAAFAPEGFFEIWGILPRITSLAQMTPRRWEELAAGILNVHRYYRSLNRNGYNLGLLIIESKTSRMELRAVLIARSNYAPWVRSDHTGFEVMLGEMATFVPPEQIAADARNFWKPDRKENV